MVRQSLEAVLRHASIPRASLPKGKTLGLALSCRPTNNRPTGPPIVYFSGERRRQQGIFSRLLPLYRAQPRAGPHGPPSARLSLVKRPRERAGCARPLLTHYALDDCLGRSAATRQHAYRTLFRAALDAGFIGEAARRHEWRLGTRRYALQAADRQGSRPKGCAPAKRSAAQGNPERSVNSTLTPILTPILPPSLSWIERNSPKAEVRDSNPLRARHARASRSFARGSSCRRCPTPKGPDNQITAASSDKQSQAC